MNEDEVAEDRWQNLFCLSLSQAEEILEALEGPIARRIESMSKAPRLDPWRVDAVGGDYEPPYCEPCAKETARTARRRYSVPAEAREGLRQGAGVLRNSCQRCFAWLNLNPRWDRQLFKVTSCLEDWPLRRVHPYVILGFLGFLGGRRVSAPRQRCKAIDLAERYLRVKGVTLE